MNTVKVRFVPLDSDIKASDAYKNLSQRGKTILLNAPPIIYAEIEVNADGTARIISK